MGIGSNASIKASKLNDNHLISRIAAVARGDNYYSILEWADGGDLRNLWNQGHKLKLTGNNIVEFLQQFRGIAGALEKLRSEKHDKSTDEQKNNADIPAAHFVVPIINTIDADVPGSSSTPPIIDAPDDEDQSNWHHGDLKPENILRFKQDSQWLGKLQISDLGLAKQHQERTSLREVATAEKLGSTRYEPPESYTDRETKKARSRRYDIWSMGCITRFLFLKHFQASFEILKE